MNYNPITFSYEPLFDLVPQYYSSLYAESCYFNAGNYITSPLSSFEDQLSPLPIMPQESTPSSPAGYFSVSPNMAYFSSLSPLSEEQAASPGYLITCDQAPSYSLFEPCDTSAVACLAHVDSSSSVTTTESEAYDSIFCEQKKTRSGGGGKKRATKKTRAKRNQFLLEKNKHDSSDDEKQFKCTVSDCGKIFKRQEHLKRHVKSIHDKIRDYKCNFPGCDRAFSRSDNLNQHLRTHRADISKRRRID